MEKFERLGLPE